MRVVVPGYIGARSVKWLEEIAVRSTPWAGYFQDVVHRLLREDQSPAPGIGMPLGLVALNSDVVSPGRRCQGRPGAVGDPRLRLLRRRAVGLSRRRLAGPWSDLGAGRVVERPLFAHGTPRPPRSQRTKPRCGTQRGPSTTPAPASPCTRCRPMSATGNLTARSAPRTATRFQHPAPGRTANGSRCGTSAHRSSR